MLRVLLLAAITVGTATLTFALMALGSLVGVAYRSDGVPIALPRSIARRRETLEKSVVGRTHRAGHAGHQRARACVASRFHADP